MSSHPETELQNALTAPADKDRSAPSALNNSQLSQDQLQEAVDHLVIKDVIAKFPRYDRLYADPDIPGQTFCLHSFVPAKGAVPDKDGIYGMIKFRGAFSSESDADKHAENLIKKNDSYHRIYHSYVGRPVPLSHNPRYVKDSKEVQLSEKVAETLSSHVKETRAQEKAEIAEIKEREKRLLQDNAKVQNQTVPVEPEPEEAYITARVKKAQLVWTYIKTRDKMEEMRRNIISCREVIAKMDESDPELNKTYYDKYMKTREEVGIPRDDDSFIKYMVEDGDKELGF
jgi:hypothetical protein